MTSFISNPPMKKICIQPRMLITMTSFFNKSFTKFVDHFYISPRQGHVGPDDRQLLVVLHPHHHLVVHG